MSMSQSHHLPTCPTTSIPTSTPASTSTSTPASTPTRFGVARGAKVIVGLVAGLIALGGLSSLSGCGVGYNGSLTFDGRSEEDLAKEEAFRQQMAYNRHEGNLRQERASFDGRTQTRYPANVRNPQSGPASHHPQDSRQMVNANANSYGNNYPSNTAKPQRGFPQEPRVSTVGYRDQTMLRRIQGESYPDAYQTARVGQYETGARTGVNSINLYGNVGRGVSNTSSPLDSPDNLWRVTYAQEGADFDPEIDPSGLWMVYASTQHRETADIYIKRVNSTTVTQITDDPADDMMPTFSPNGKQIAFASKRSGNWNIYLMNIDGGQVIELTSSPADEIHPTFSPDGTRVAYSVLGMQSGQWEIAVIDLERPQQPRYITNGLFPNWSPVEDKILFQRARQRGTYWFSVWTLDLEGYEGKRPTEIAASRNAAAITPSWSADGENIVFATVVNPDDPIQSKPVQADIWVVRKDGSGRANLTNSPFANLQPVWSSDGTVYFVSNRSEGGLDNIWAIKPQRALDIAELARTAGERRSVMTASRPGPSSEAMSSSSAQTQAQAQASSDSPGQTGDPVASSPSVSTPAMPRVTTGQNSSGLIQRAMRQPPAQTLTTGRSTEMTSVDTENEAFEPIQ